MEGRAKKKVRSKKKSSPALKCLSINIQNQTHLSDAKRNQVCCPHTPPLLRRIISRYLSTFMLCTPHQVRCRLKAASYAYGQGPRAREKLFAKMSASSARKSTKQMRASGEGKWGMHVVNPVDSIDLSEVRRREGHA